MLKKTIGITLKYTLLRRTSSDKKFETSFPMVDKKVCLSFF